MIRPSVVKVTIRPDRAFITSSPRLPAEISSPEGAVGNYSPVARVHSQPEAAPDNKPGAAATDKWAERG